MEMDDALHRREADPGALEFALSVQSLERAEELPAVRHVEPRAVVADRERRLAVLRRGAEDQMRGRALPREFPRVLDEVRERDAHESCVGLHRDASLGGELHLSVGFAQP